MRPMEKNIPTKRPRRRLVTEIDPDLIERLQIERVQTRRPVNHILEEILARHFDRADAVIVTS